MDIEAVACVHNLQYKFSTSDVVCRWLVVTRVHCGQTVRPIGLYSYYGTLIGKPTPGIQWYKFRPSVVTTNRGMGPPVRRFLSNYFDLLFRLSLTCRIIVERSF